MKDEVTPFTFKKFPLQKSSMYYASTAYSQKLLEQGNLNQLKKEFLANPTKGYCEKIVQNMTKVSNQHICANGTMS